MATSDYKSRSDRLSGSGHEDDRQDRRRGAAARPTAAPGALDDRFQAATPLRRLFNKVFPDHWSFLLGEIALYSFIVLLLTGTFLALFFDPSMREVVYNGSYAPLRGIEMSQAYETSLNISFDVRGGLVMRQMHHWAALLFMAAIVVHMFRVFFTGAFRKPREAELDHRRRCCSGSASSRASPATRCPTTRCPAPACASPPRSCCRSRSIGSWVTTSLFGGEFPGDGDPAPASTSCTCCSIPAILLALITVHMGLLVKQKHTQWPGPGRTNHNVVGVRMFPGFAAKAGGFFMIVFARDRAAGRPLPDQPDLAVRPVQGGGGLRRRASPTGTSCSSTARPV